MARGLTGDELLRAEAFMQAAIPLLRKPYVNKKGETTTPRGVHCVFSGLGTQFRRRFPDVDYRMALEELESGKAIATVRCRGGAQVYLWEDKPASYQGAQADKTAEIDAEMDRILGE